MAVLHYNGYYLSVFLTPDKSGNLSCIPFVEIRNKRSHDPAARLMLNEAFSTADEASAHGFDMGKQWVDERVAIRKPVQAGGVVTQADLDSQPVRFGFKTWLTSVFS